MSKRMSTIFWVGFPVFLITIATAGGIAIYRYGDRLGKSEIIDVTASPVPPSPEPTTASEPDRAELKVQVLNGRGIPGAANEAKKVLEDLGYKDIATGNASSYDFNNTEVATTKDKADYLELLIKDLSDTYQATSSTQQLEDTNDFDAVVIVGESR